MAGKISTGAVYVKVPRPTRKGGAWAIVDGPVGGETAEDAATFAAAIVSSVETHLARERQRPGVDPSARAPQTSAAKLTRGHGMPRSRFASASVPVCHRLSYVGTDWRDTGKGWRVADTGPAIEQGPDRYVTLSIIDDVTTVERKHRTVAPRPAAPAPAPRKTKTPAGVGRAVARKAAPPVVAPPAPTSDSMAPCHRCGRSDWKTPAGRAWHVANNPDCGKYRKPDRHQYTMVGA